MAMKYIKMNGSVFKSTRHSECLKEFSVAQQVHEGMKIFSNFDTDSKCIWKSNHKLRRAIFKCVHPVTLPKAYFK